MSHGDLRTTLNRLLGLLSPPRCLACGSLGDAPLELRICPSCRLALSVVPRLGLAVPGVDRVAAAADYRGPAIGLVRALKSGAAPGAAETAAELMAEAGGRPPGSPTLVPVAAAHGRRLRRGLDPAEQLAQALAARLGLPLARALRRLDSRRQRGRSRGSRLEDPPRFAAVAPVPSPVLLVDDVLTTGGTLSSCAAALRATGARDVAALTFARTPPPAKVRLPFIAGGVGSLAPEIEPRRRL